MLAHFTIDTTTSYINSLKFDEVNRNFDASLSISKQRLTIAVGVSEF